MDVFVIVLYIIALVLSLLIAWYVANCFYDVACEKGHTDKRYFWLPFLLGLVGYLLVVALPDRKKKQTPSEKAVKPLFVPVETQSSVGKWACPDCGEVLPGDVIQCKCGYKK